MLYSLVNERVVELLWIAVNNGIKSNDISDEFAELIAGLPLGGS